SRTPQIITLVVDDSNSMNEPVHPGKSKARLATDAIQDIIISAQAGTHSSRAFRYLLNIAKFGDAVTPMAEASAPMDVNLDLVTFEGNSGWTNMAPALEWARTAVEKAIQSCRSSATYDEVNSPPPLVVFISDGENTGPNVAVAAGQLKSVSFA